MRHAKTLLSVAIACALAFSGPATAQLRRRPPPPPPPVATQSEFTAQAGSDTVYFAAGAYLPDAAAQAVLANQARLLMANPALQATIEGHDDGRNTRNYSLALAERRAGAVRDYLVSMGVEPWRLTIVSWGKERPVAANLNEAAGAMNRRVVTVLAPLIPAVPAPIIPQAAQR